MPGIGSFVIGESALGDAPFDYHVTVLSQYANSPTIMALLDDISQWLDVTLDVDTFYDYVWNVLTAQGFGLDIWGRIVGVGRVYPVDSATYLGFEGQDFQSFDHGIYWSGGGGSANYSLSDDAYRRLILAKAMANITDCSIPAINNILKAMFPGRGNCYVVDNANMTMTYQFDFVLTPTDRTIVINSGVLPHPNGVTVNVVSL